MKFYYRKDIFIFLIISAVLSLFGAVTITLEGAYPFLGEFTGAGNYILAAYFLLHSIITFIVAFRMHKLDARKATRRLAIFQFSALPFLFIVLAFLSLGFQPSYGSWVYYLNIASLSSIVLFDTFIEVYISYKLIAKDHGFTLVRSLSSMASSFGLALGLLYASTPLKVLAILQVSGMDPQKFLDNPFLFILTEFIVLFLIVIISLIMLYIGITCYLTSRENNLVDLRHNLKFTKRTLKKYHVGFWFGIVFTLILFTTSLISSFSFFLTYFSLAALYLSLLLIRLPTFFYEGHLHKKYIDEPETCFRELHKEAIYASIVLMLYSIVIVFFGVKSPATTDKPSSIYLVLIFLAPMSVLRATMSTIRQHKARKSGDPHILVRTCVDVVVALFAIVNTLVILGTIVRNGTLMLLGALVSVWMVLSCIALSVFLLVIGIRGLKGKRVTALEKYKVYFEEEKKEIDEFDQKEKEQQSLVHS